MNREFFDDLVKTCERHGLSLDGGIDFELMPEREEMIIDLDPKRVRRVKKFISPVRFKITGVIVKEFREDDDSE